MAQNNHICLNVLCNIPSLFDGCSSLADFQNCLPPSPCSWSYFTVDGLNVFVFSLSLFDSRCSLCGRSPAATLATLTRSSPRWWWSWRRPTSSSSWTWTRTSSRASPTPTPSSSFRSEEFLRDSALAQLPSSTLIQHPIARPRTVSGFIRVQTGTTSTRHTCRYLLSVALDAGFSVGPVDRPAMVSTSTRLQGIQYDGESVVTCASSADPQQCAFTWFSSLWPLAPWTFHDPYVRYVFTHVSVGCSWKAPERTDVLPESVPILVLSSKWHKKTTIPQTPVRLWYSTVFI